eukprot:TRINITY_DN50359_c0_g1_i1.p1 TRINITY_DN50359_c0_g1~~TRINITY_DN50359_c0_g1_i1.p1  ORF type:complete len:760 (+),score=180.01 TRINITY_DN50359_c0_g1_i1:287-2566(+)
MLDPASPAGALAGVAFAVFGLGDRTHVSFNRMGELTDGALERLGGRRICKLGVGDDSDDIVRDFSCWRKDVLWPVLENELGAGNSSLTTNTMRDPVLRISTDVSSLPSETPGKPADVLARFYFQAEPIRVTGISELRKAPSPEAAGLSTVHIEFDVTASQALKADYAPAGTLELLPENDAAEIAAMLPILGISEAAKPGDIGDLDCCLTFSPADGSEDVLRPFPTPCSLREALTRYCDLHRAPTRRMLKAVCPSLEPSAARDRVRQLLADDGALTLVQDEALAWTQHEFWSALGAERLDLGAFLLHCPRQRPRMYTIASSPLAHPSEIHVCASLVSHPSLSLTGALEALQARGIFQAGAKVPERGERWFGLCSKWLCTRLRPGSMVLARTRPSAALHLPAQDAPLVMVGAGAGVAPFRAFWQGLRRGGKRNCPAALFFGCQHPDRDWIYRAEMTAAAEGEASLSELCVAFSRKGEEGVYDTSGCCGEYVQDLLRARSADLRAWLQAGAVICICGSNRMAQGVLDALACIAEGGEAEVSRLRAAGHIMMECWGEPSKPPDIEAFAARSGAAGYKAAVDPAEEKAAALAQELLEAVKNGDQPGVERLLTAGANPNYQAGARKYTRIGLRQEVGETALHWAALRGDQVSAERLLSSRADPDLRDQDGKAPLHIAAFNGVLGVSQQLLAAKCDPDAQDLRGNTALQWVILAGASMRMIRLLLKHGARGDLANADGELPADVAEEQGSEAAANHIREAVEKSTS